MRGSAPSVGAGLEYDVGYDYCRLRERMSERHPVFIDYTGRRWRRVRRAVLIGGIVTTIVGLGVALSLFLSDPLVPELHPASLVPQTHPLTRREQRERTALRRLIERAIA